MCFYYEKMYFHDQSIQKLIDFILEKASLDSSGIHCLSWIWGCTDVTVQGHVQLLSVAQLFQLQSNGERVIAYFDTAS